MKGFNFLKLASASESELLEMIGEYLLKEGIKSATIRRTKEGKIEMKTLPFDIVEGFDLATKTVQAQEMAINALKNGK